MKDQLYRDASGQTFQVKFVDHNMNGSWVHYSRVGDDHQYSCLIDAFKERFQPVEKSR